MILRPSVADLESESPSKTTQQDEKQAANDGTKSNKCDLA